jgi:plasmid rolling circle replication initiator protein Rep
LTIKNPNGEKLQDTISQILSGWGLFMKQRRIERVVAGYWRTLEVTFKKSRDEYHPHIHAILMVDKSYFKGADYMDTKYWSEIWGRVIRVDYSPVCFVKRLSPSQARNEVSEVTKQQVVRSKSDREIEHNLSDIERVTSTEIARVAKYTYKNESVVKRSKVETDRIVSVLSTALKARRLCCFGGIMKEIAKRLKVKLEDGDLINIDEESIRPDVEMIILRYQWSVGIKNYVCVCCEEITQ